MLGLFSSFVLLIFIFSIIYFTSHIYTKKFNNDSDKNQYSKVIIKNYIGFILITFGILKLYDISKFAEIFSKYDIVSEKIKFYPYIYPFIELLIGYSIINNIYINFSLMIMKIFMMVSIISVLISLYKGAKLRCGCMGSFFNIPLSYTTLSENIVMIILSFIYFLK